MPARSILAQYAIVFPLHSRNSPGRTKTYGASRSAARVVGCPNGSIRELSQEGDDRVESRSQDKPMTTYVYEYPDGTTAKFYIEDDYV
jgi:hypothetical protein